MENHPTSTMNWRDMLSLAIIPVAAVATALALGLLIDCAPRHNPQAQTLLTILDVFSEVCDSDDSAETCLDKIAATRHNPAGVLKSIASQSDTPEAAVLRDCVLPLVLPDAAVTD